MGCFFVIHEDQSQSFTDLYFESLDRESLRIHGNRSSKILIVKSKTRPSWQYHKRCAEIWQVFQWTVGLVRSNNDVEGDIFHYFEGEQIKFTKGELHRLTGLSDYRIVAEIWQHTRDIPSDESDIVRVQDDFDRK